MATVNRFKTFTSGQTVVPDDLHQLVDSATVTNIVDADIDAAAAIAASKLASTLDLSGKTVTLPAASVTQAKLAANVVGNGPAFRAAASGNTSVAHATWTKVNLADETFDTNSNFASSRFTPTVAGYYQINAGVYSASAPPFLHPGIYKNGAFYSSGNHGSQQTWSSTAADLVYLNGTTDYVELYAWQASGVTVNVMANGSTFLSGFLARAA